MTLINAHSDTLRRFLFENTPIRGEIVCLEATWQSVLDRHDYPPALRKAMGELMAAAALLTATLKLNGSMILQIQGSGPVNLLVVECTNDFGIRATAKWNGDLVNMTLAEMVGNGNFVITLAPKEGGQPYQGIVPLEGDSIAEILQNYMMRSEQLETRLWLAESDSRACGLLLQKLPEQADTDLDAWDRTTQLAGTITTHELTSLNTEEVIHRLFHQENVRLFAAQSARFECTCSKANVARMLKMLGSDEVHDIIQEQNRIEVHCEFCNARYEFDKVDAEALFISDIVSPGNETKH